MRNKTPPRARKQKVPAKSTKGLTIKNHTPRSAGDEYALDGRSHRTRYECRRAGAKRRHVPMGKPPQAAQRH
jgi:hypothetical protein